MYKVIGSKDTRTARVLWMLEELGVPYEHVPARPHSAEAVAANPTGKVPVLIDGDARITDSTAIMTYLADKHGKMTAPAGTIARAQQDSMTHFLLDELDACLWTATRHAFILPEEHRLPAIEKPLMWEFSRSEKRLAERMGKHPFVMGDQMSLPDILAAECLSWAAGAKFPLTDPGLGTYLTRMQARPAYQRVKAK